jgi:hypothetical protein
VLDGQAAGAQGEALKNSMFPGAAMMYAKHSTAAHSSTHWHSMAGLDDDIMTMCVSINELDRLCGRASIHAAKSVRVCLLAMSATLLIMS